MKVTSHLSSRSVNVAATLQTNMGDLQRSCYAKTDAVWKINYRAKIVSPCEMKQQTKRLERLRWSCQYLFAQSITLRIKSVSIVTQATVWHYRGDNKELRLRHIEMKEL